MIPKPSKWYITLTGKLLKVKFVAYNGPDIAMVVVEYSTGDKQFLSSEDWFVLSLKEFSK